VIDLYQLHWPERKTNTFGRRDYLHVEEDSWTPFADVLAHLAREIQAGRVRAIGLSNETPWGVMSCLGLAEEFGLPRIAAVQNPYSLLNRLFEIGLAEVAIREDCGLLAYSPLAFGTLSGKYLDGTRPAGARLTLFSHYQRYLRPQAIAATAAYVGVARRFALDPAQMALAFVCRQRFLTSVIIGATTLPQLVSDLAGCQMVLDDEVLLAIEAIHDANPNPAP
jgi:aryl-alcohol dehydrogenase-like predicted oxidoreductase